MNADRDGKQVGLDIVHKVRKVRNELVAKVLVYKCSRQEVLATEAGDVQEGAQGKDHNLVALRSTVFGQCHVGSAKFLQTILVQADQPTAGFIEAGHGRVDGDPVADSVGSNGQVGEGEVL